MKIRIPDLYYYCSKDGCEAKLRTDFWKGRKYNELTGWVFDELNNALCPEHCFISFGYDTLQKRLFREMGLYGG